MSKSELSAIEPPRDQLQKKPPLRETIKVDISQSNLFTREECEDFFQPEDAREERGTGNFLFENPHFSSDLPGNAFTKESKTKLSSSEAASNQQPSNDISVAETSKK